MPAKTCPATGKICYLTRSDAATAVKMTLRRGRVRSDRRGACKSVVVPYLCKECNAWHIGHEEVSVAR